MSNARCLLSVASAPRLAFGLHLGGFARALHPGMSTIASGPGESPALCFRRRWGCLQGARSNGPHLQCGGKLNQEFVVVPGSIVDSLNLLG